MAETYRLIEQKISDVEKEINEADLRDILESLLYRIKKLEQKNSNSGRI